MRAHTPSRLASSKASLGTGPRLFACRTCAVGGQHSSRPYLIHVFGPMTSYRTAIQMRDNFERQITSDRFDTRSRIVCIVISLSILVSYEPFDARLRVLAALTWLAMTRSKLESLLSFSVWGTIVHQRFRNLCEQVLQSKLRPRSLRKILQIEGSVSESLRKPTKRKPKHSKYKCLFKKPTNQKTGESDIRVVGTQYRTDKSRSNTFWAGGRD